MSLDLPEEPCSADQQSLVRSVCNTRRSGRRCTHSMKDVQLDRGSANRASCSVQLCASYAVAGGICSVALEFPGVVLLQDHRAEGMHGQQARSMIACAWCCSSCHPVVTGSVALVYIADSRPLCVVQYNLYLDRRSAAVGILLLAFCRQAPFERNRPHFAPNFRPCCDSDVSIQS